MIWIIHTENEHGIRKSAEDGEEEAADETGTENLKQELAAAGEVCGGEVHEIPINDDEKEVAESGVGAGQKAVGLLAFSGGGSSGTDPVGHETRGAIADEKSRRSAGEEQEREAIRFQKHFKRHGFQFSASECV